MSTTAYKRKPVNALGPLAARELDDELARIERWGISVNLRLSARPEATFTCPDDDGKLIYFDCASGQDAAAPIRYYPDHPLYPGFDALDSEADILFRFDNAIVFLNQAGDAGIGGFGNLTQAPDVLLIAATADINQWDNVATRRPLFVGGSAVTLDAGTSMQMLLPGITANPFGYDLQVAPDGRTVLAVPLPQPDFTATDTSSDDGTTLISGTGLTPWTIFPDGSDTQPDKLEVTIPDPQEPGEVIMRVKLRVLNTTSNRSGTITIGVGADGALPLPDDQQTFIIPAAFSGALDLAVVFTFSEVTTAPVVMTVWYQGSGDHQQFNLETDNAEGQHQFEVSISREGGGTQPPIVNHQLLQNRDPDPPETAHMASSISFDDTFNPADVLIGANVQAAIQDHVASKEKRHEAGDIYLNDALMPYDALDNVDVAIQKHVITGSDPAYTDKHPASEISYTDNQSIGANQVQAALDQLKVLIDGLGAPGPKGWGGWTKVGANTNIGTVAQNWVRIRVNSAGSLNNNVNVAYGLTTGWIQPITEPLRRTMLHAHVTLEVNRDCTIRMGFEVGGTVPVQGFSQQVCYSANTAHNCLHLSAPVPLSPLQHYVIIRVVPGIDPAQFDSATVTVHTATFWMEYE